MNHSGHARLLLDLNSKFGSNLNAALSEHSDLSLGCEIRSRAVPSVASILESSLPLTNWQREILAMFDEVFADITCSIYLAGCGLDKPAQTTLRRSLEIGFATVYLWDLPHTFWGWKDHDNDLTFSGILDHFGDEGFLQFVRTQNPTFKSESIVDLKQARSLYRSLSNIVHGKMATFETNLPDRFRHNPEDWRSNLEQISQVQAMLLQLWRNRFPCVAAKLVEELPPLRAEEEL